ncbi:MAG: type 4a pilus biogenesis protein PilO [Fibrobacteria bacterium]|nr:type 4a pilus biogenesis protein PilO [Fibrobacteria bacterium]
MKNLSLNGKLWIFACLCVGAAGYLGWSFKTEKWDTYIVTIKENEEIIFLKRARLQKIILQKQRLEQLNAEIENADKEFKELNEMFPDKDIIPKRIKDLNRAARHSSVLPVSFEPVNTVEKEYYTENFYKVKVSSDYHRLGRFLESIANFKYPTAITEVKIVQNPQMMNESTDKEFVDVEGNLLLTEFKLKTYTARK